jgi:hypothetical protein
MNLNALRAGYLFQKKANEQMTKQAGPPLTGNLEGGALATKPLSEILMSGGEQGAIPASLRGLRQGAVSAYRNRRPWYDQMADDAFEATGAPILKGIDSLADYTRGYASDMAHAANPYKWNQTYPELDAWNNQAFEDIMKYPNKAMSAVDEWANPAFEEVSKNLGLQNWKKLFR